jgi:hypothetical protein
VTPTPGARLLELDTRRRSRSLASDDELLGLRLDEVDDGDGDLGQVSRRRPDRVERGGDVQVAPPARPRLGAPSTTSTTSPAPG